MDNFNELLALLAKNKEQISDELWEKISELCGKMNNEETIKKHKQCFNCGSTNISQSGIEVICSDCGYISEDWSSDC